MATVTATTEYQAELERLREQVQALREQLRHSQRLATMGTLAAMVAHEFNNILTPVISYAQMAQKNPAMTGKAIARAASGGQRASAICQALLGFAGDSPPEPEEFALAELVDETLSAMAREPAKDLIDLHVSVAPDLTVRTRRVELQQVLLNLLLNARSAVLSRSGGRRIEVAARTGRDGLEIEVSDTGVGIPAENLERIFEPFFTTKQRQAGTDEGSGLGLAICREIVGELGGRIEVRSVEGEGTTFAVVLPCGRPRRT